MFIAVVVVSEAGSQAALGSAASGWLGCRCSGWIMLPAENHAAVEEQKPQEQHAGPQELSLSDMTGRESHLLPESSLPLR